MLGVHGLPGGGGGGGTRSGKGYRLRSDDTGPTAAELWLSRPKMARVEARGGGSPFL